MKKKIKILQLIILIVILIALILVVTDLWPLMKNLSTKEGQLEFKYEIDSLGIKGIFLLAGLQFIQIFLVILPGEPLEILAGMCYGTWGGLLFITISVFITTTIIVLLVKKFGKKFIYNFFNKEKIDKIENSKLFKNPNKIEILICVLFFIPGTPKDLIIYLGGLLPINPLRFILISTFVRFPSVISSTIAGDSLSTGNWKMMIIVYGITFILTAIVIFIVNKFDKNKTTKSAINILK